MLLSSTLALLLPSALAAYSIVDDYTTGNFANQFDFFTGNDPTNGYVNYVDYATAQSSGLYSVSNSQVYIGVDHNNTATGRGRDSVRIASKKSYQHGLIILDLAHMPGGACGTWPAFWLLSTTAQWPNGGEIDIIEGVNSQSYNTMAAHTDAGCSISSNGSMSGQITTSNCDINAPGQASNQGCSIKSNTQNSFGSGFNANGGGVYATEWTSDGFSIWFFPRGAIPHDITNGTPDTSGWGLPMSRFAGACDWDEKVVNQQIIFDVTFCGDWAGNTFGSDDTCKSKAPTCQAFVQNNPTAFADTYWSINSLKVFQRNGQASTTTSVSSATVTTSNSYGLSATSTSTQIVTTSSVTTSFVTSIKASTTTVVTTSSVPTSFVTSTRVSTSPVTTSTIQITSSALFTTASSSTTLISFTSSTTTTATSLPMTSSQSPYVSSSTTSSSISYVPSSATTSSMAYVSSSTTTSSAAYVSSWTTSQTMPSQPATSSSASYTSSAVAGWNGWPNTFSTVTRSAGWGAPNNATPGGWGGPGNWGGSPGSGHPTGA